MKSQMMKMMVRYLMVRSAQYCDNYFHFKAGHHSALSSPNPLLIVLQEDIDSRNTWTEIKKLVMVKV